MRTATTLPLLLLASITLSCDASPSVGQPHDEVATGKADGSSAVEITAADEPLMSSTLRQQLCSAVAAAHPWSTVAHRNAFVDECLEHEFTVTEIATSTLYAHLDDGDAMTMQMRVRVEAGDDAWETRLTREFGDFRFRWSATVDSLPNGDDRDAFIDALADEMGEFFSPDDFPDNFRSVDSIDDFPPEVRDTVQTRVAEIDEEIKQGPTDTSSAGLADTFPQEILRDTEVVGYAVEVWFFIDHPLFDGGGTTLYLNVLGEIVEEVDWFG